MTTITVKTAKIVCVISFPWLTAAEFERSCASVSQCLSLPASSPGPEMATHKALFEGSHCQWGWRMWVSSSLRHYRWVFPSHWAMASRRGCSFGGCWIGRTYPGYLVGWSCTGLAKSFLIDRVHAGDGGILGSLPSGTRPRRSCLRSFGDKVSLGGVGLFQFDSEVFFWSVSIISWQPQYFFSLNYIDRALSWLIILFFRNFDQVLWSELCRIHG